ncbi:MAG TPA: crossover junction endodeoxyribonuclease RuvC [Gammaproteobacteria bacterium]|nr:crossover junction endodeoxyribonuclease RuvC [Gammaproteobacteria bacterium]MDP7660863.1 crossover junction endodeoxyribonuclease RuvC [Gammaproteobacteria bacterium]HJP39795.1 crossover junction endodeoxyribonuclease RuvC [Gammaproteobacteria bacterium]
MDDPIRILGIDPGSRITGYGIIDSNGAVSRHVASGCLRLGAGEFSERLREIFLRIGDLVSEYAPNHLAIEQVFVHKNADSALKLGHARAAAICATFSGGAVFHEYAAREVKQAVVGSGGAEKHQIQHMVKEILTLESTPVSDEADALAVALCHAHSFRLQTGITSLTSAPRRSTRRSSWRKFAG